MASFTAKALRKGAIPEEDVVKTSRSNMKTRIDRSQEANEVGRGSQKTSATRGKHI